MNNYRIETFIDESTIQENVCRLAAEIDKHYQGSDEEIVVIGLLKGAFVFTADLVREMSMPLIVDFINASSYGNGTESTGNVRIDHDIGSDVSGKHVLLVEDIVDTGRTFKKVVSLMQSRGAKSVKTCSILDKPSRRVVEMKLDFCGIVIPDLFVVGYGLDYAQKHRDLPYIGKVVFED